MIDRRNEITREAIDWVFSKHRFNFRDNEKVKAICEMRLSGAKYEEIGKKVNLTGGRCRQQVQKVIRIYKHEVSKIQNKPKMETYKSPKPYTKSNLPQGTKATATIAMVVGGGACWGISRVDFTAEQIDRIEELLLQILEEHEAPKMKGGE